MSQGIPSKKAQVQPSGGDDSTPMVREVNLTVASGEKLNLTIDVAEGAEVKLWVQKFSPVNQPRSSKSLRFSNPVRNPFIQTLRAALTRLGKQGQILLIVLALLVYLSSRFIGLDQFPIYFFTDEAIQTNQAADLVHNSFDSSTGEFLPTFLVNGNQYNLGTSVYIQVLPFLIFGKSIWVTRGVCVLFTLLAALAVGLTARNVFKSNYPYLAILILSITPAWFIHSRTAFETSLAVSFYAAFIYCYLMYRKGPIKYIFAAAVFAALTFYSYSPAQLVIVVTLLGLLLSDLRFHWKNRAAFLTSLGLGLLFVLPYIRFLINHPGENINHLQILNSYWIQDLTLPQKLGIYLKQYLQMLNPYYWFAPNQVDIVRHIMKGYGQLIWWSLPFVALGLILTCMRLRKPEYRLLLISVLAAPSGAALASVGITRALFMVIPTALLTAIGLDQIITWLTKIKVKPAVSAGVCLALLIGVNGYMVYDALKNGPTWYSDYGLAGMQYGAPQLFGEVKEYLKENPQTKMVVSSVWANGTDVLARYFFKDPFPFQLGSIEMWLLKELPLDKNNVFVVVPEEMAQVQASNKFKSVEIIKTIPYPDGNPGFYFIRVAYVDNITQVFADEITARHKLNSGQIVLPDGTKVSIEFPTLDMGQIQDAFDGNALTLIRTSEANPMILKLHFAQPYTLNQITLRIGGTPTTIDLSIFPSGSGAPLQLKRIVPVSSDYRDITFNLSQPIQTDQLIISVKNTENDEPAHVHLWEVTLK
ncbi:MAG: ArnT family glycosyltransferase [Anaerolineaceae bacterium]